MKTYLSLKSIFLYSESSKTKFYTEFGSKLNVIYGPNTAGKSTLIQLILFAFGINDNKFKLVKILSENIFVRLNIIIEKNGVSENYIFIRKDETLYIKDGNSKVSVFNGMGANNSVEHVKLKHFFSELFNFKLTLESKDGIVPAPMETIFLPYYVSQDVGWVYLRKSFTNLDFYKNFREDFLDYYLGIINDSDKEEKKRLELDLQAKRQQLNFYITFEKTNEVISDSIILNKALEGKGDEFINQISQKKNVLLEYENKYIKLSNALTFSSQRLAVVSKVNRNHNQQFPGKDPCPTCKQILPSKIQDVYEHYQEENDTIKLKASLSEDNKELQSKLNSLNKKITELREELNYENKKFLKYSDNDITLDDFIKSKANLVLDKSIIENIGTLSLEVDALSEKLKKFNSDESLGFERAKKNKIFKNYYQLNNVLLDVPKVEDDRFNNVYELSSFPFQGVQLHLAVLSYHLSFNKIINDTKNIHRLPFIMDSVFKEDIDGPNRERILKFINQNKPTDIQTIISIADSKEKDPKLSHYKKAVFDKETHYILIGNYVDKESLLSECNMETFGKIINDSYEIMETV
ncbi:hypothetical protein SAMN05443549_101240 [Flavobacterium fluvii]|uniref:AAA domain-containing protein n=1 Tax=Flavobacterium fluvii TaxID=468056 RepID=A0A1M5E8W6_9FLAO|nr:ATP-binding protein [Flavobacterium fluvii]SHF75615.1 hypothetical protein SAMN05443549_101240 [Flavobacterium fluvii]